MRVFLPVPSLPGTGIGLALAVCLVVPGPAPAQGVEALRPCLRDLSGQLAQFLRGKEENAIAVGEFTSAGGGEGLSPGLQKLLTEELQKLNVRAGNSAPLKVQGEYRLDPTKTPPLFHLTVRLIRPGAKVPLVKEFDKTQGLGTVESLAVPAMLILRDPGDGNSPEMVAEAVERARAQPVFDIQDTGVRASRPPLAAPNSTRRTSDVSPYGMEVCVEAGGRFTPRPPRREDGQAYVELRRGEVFAVRLINDSDHDAAVQLSLDGLSMFTFSENKAYSYLIVPRHARALVKGWFRSLGKSDQFLVTEYPQSAAGQLFNPAGVGAITATFAAAWDPKMEVAPRDENAVPKALDSAVGRGQTVDAPFEEVPRHRGRVRDVITIRYKAPSGTDAAR